VGIKRMCELPVESLQTSGMLWFPDLTLTDPYFLLPMFATGSLVLIVTVSKLIFSVVNLVIKTLIS